SSLTQQAIVREPWRGDILDINGNPLATSRPVKRVCADPTLIGDPQAHVGRALSPIVGMGEREVIDRLQITTRLTTNGIIRTNHFVDLRCEVSLDQWQQVTNAIGQIHRGPAEASLPKREKRFWQLLRQKSVFGVDSQRRNYPNNELAAHVV